MYVLRALLLQHTSRHPVFSKRKVPRVLIKTRGTFLFAMLNRSTRRFRLAKAIHGGSFIIKNVKDRVKLGYRHQFCRPLRKIDKF